MKKLILLITGLTTVALVVTGAGARLASEIGETVGVASLETRIREHIKELKTRRSQIFEKIFELRRQAGAERSAQRRAEQEYRKVDDACERLAAKINGQEGLGGPIQIDAVSATFQPVSTVAPATVDWGPHTLGRTRALALLTQWGKIVQDLEIDIDASRQKVERYEAAVQSLDQDTDVFKQSVAALETKLKKLLTAREVLTVQRQVSEILAGLDGRNVPGRTAELVAELQDHNDKLRGEIAANGGIAGTGGMLIRPDDDLRTDTADAILKRYGVAGLR